MEAQRSHVGDVLVATSVLATVVLVTLKLCGIIDWPWVLVLAPFWVPTAISLALISLLLLAMSWARGR